jgi:hypothetical protein
MDELENMLFWDNVIGIGSLVAPVVVSLATIALMWRNRRNESERAFERIGMIGAFLTIAIGVAGSYATGELLLSALVASDVPWHLFVRGWHRMWYPAGLGIILGMIPMLFLLKGRKAL